MYEKLSDAANKILREKSLNKRLSPYAFKDEDAVRRRTDTHDADDFLRAPFVRDADKIINCPYFSRYADKTQVFSLVKNDDVSRRSLHVQLVSRIARTIGNALSLNQELIEAAALGHDIGHTPFGHAGERVLDGIYHERTGKRFFHNLHSVRVLDKIFPYNITLQTLDGILTHDGEMPKAEYAPRKILSFAEFDTRIQKSYTENGYLKSLSPSTMEAAVVRISDVIAYLGKDRQDAAKLGVVKESDFSPTAIGDFNAEFINNVTVNVIENSLGKPYIMLDGAHFDGLKTALKENYALIYNSPEVKEKTAEILAPVMRELYYGLLEDLEKNDRNSPVFTAHIDYVNQSRYKRDIPYEENPKDDIVADFIASMTDDYFISLFNALFKGHGYKIEYKDYF
ncbi:MAG: HD domain-containing protein [Clostridia bacterium]|nr:HD domain-containing protein [Clostridia bacterium]